MTIPTGAHVDPSSHDPVVELTVLDHAECYRLLGTRQIGRLGVIAEHHPLIIPMNFAMDDDIIVVRSGPGLKLDSARHANVTFQVDDIDAATHTGWSVLIRGVAEEMTAAHHPKLIERTARTGLQSWVPGDDLRWIRIIPHGISGRRITARPGSEWSWGIGGLM
ncbi:MAG: pyridoxamine 5'-phosphate oxidase family protein [Nakamurella sp.]